jgi:hypothetical protein
MRRERGGGTNDFFSPFAAPTFSPYFRLQPTLLLGLIKHAQARPRDPPMSPLRLLASWRPSTTALLRRIREASPARHIHFADVKPVAVDSVGNLILPSHLIARGADLGYVVNHIRPTLTHSFLMVRGTEWHRDSHLRLTGGLIKLRPSSLPPPPLLFRFAYVVPASRRCTRSLHRPRRQISCPVLTLEANKFVQGSPSSLYSLPPAVPHITRLLQAEQTTPRKSSIAPLATRYSFSPQSRPKTYRTLMSVDIRTSCPSLRFPFRSDTVSTAQLCSEHTGHLTRPIDRG